MTAGAVSRWHGLCGDFLAVVVVVAVAVAMRERLPGGKGNGNGLAGRQGNGLSAFLLEHATENQIFISTGL